MLPCYLFAQIGIKGGLNFAQISKASDINSSSKSGFHIGLILGAASKKIISHRMELLYSKQGYDYKNGTKSGDVNLDYIQMGQLLSINITKYISVLLAPLLLSTLALMR